MKKKTIFMFLVFALASSLVCAQTNEQDIYNHSLGFIYKYDSNVESMLGGIAYQHWFDNGIGLQGTVAANYIHSADYFLSLDMEVSFQLYKKTFESKHYPNPRSISTVLYTWLSCGYLQYPTREYYDGLIGGSSDIEYRETTVKALCPGLGFGLELIFFEHFSIPFAIGFLANIDEGKISSNFAYSSGFRYRF